MKMEDSKPNIASIIKNAYETLDRTKDLIINYWKSSDLELVTKQLGAIETDLNQIPEEHRCWNSQNCLDDIKGQKIWINRLTGMLHQTN